MKAPLTTTQWFSVIGFLMAAVLFGFSNFEVKGSSDKLEGRLEKRLSRIERKLDRALGIKPEIKEEN